MRGIDPVATTGRWWSGITLTSALPTREFRRDSDFGQYALRASFLLSRNHAKIGAACGYLSFRAETKLSASFRLVTLPCPTEILGEFGNMQPHAQIQKKGELYCLTRSTLQNQTVTSEI